MFVVNGTLSEPEDVGQWTVRVKVVFYEPINNTMPVETNEDGTLVIRRIK